MIVYQKNKEVFFEDVRNDTIAEQVDGYVFEKLGRKTTKSEFQSWSNSLRYMRDAIDDPEIPDDCGISIEFQIPNTSKRIDFIISGQNPAGKPQIVIVELKQWSDSEITNMDGMVLTYLGGSQRPTQHPSYQAWSYAGYLTDFNEYVYENEIGVQPCTFLHNYPKNNNAIVDPFYKHHTDKAPVFRQQEATRLSNFIKQFVKTGDNGSHIYDIEHGRIRPSKGLADALVGMISGKTEFILLDEQKEIFEIVKESTITASENPDANKTVIIVNGGPGTGKSVVAINLLVEIIGKRFNCTYVTKNSAPREVFQAKLTGTMTKTHYSNIFKPSGAFTECEEDTFDLLVIDEAHRLNEKSGMYNNLGENQIKELIHAAKTTVFFVDPHQRVAFSDIGSPEIIESFAKSAGAEIIRGSLPSQFRCGGSDGYLAWIDNCLNISETANTTFDEKHYDFRIFDNPQTMYDEIVRLNSKGDSSRLLAGYCWKWASKANPLHYDIEFPEFDFKMKWNDFNLGQGWIMHPESIEQVGCIHTSQGLEVAYAGVIIGRDLQFVDGKLNTEPLAHPGQDRNFSGLRKRLKGTEEEKKLVLEQADQLIRNTYRTLLTRGMKGTFIYCEDPLLHAEFKNKLQDNRL